MDPSLGVSSTRDGACAGNVALPVAPHELETCMKSSTACLCTVSDGHVQIYNSRARLTDPFARCRRIVVVAYVSRDKNTVVSVELAVPEMTTGSVWEGKAVQAVPALLSTVQRTQSDKKVRNESFWGTTTKS